MERELLELINEYRASKGLAKLRVESKLTATAKWMASDLTKDSQLGHVDSLGRDLRSRLAAFGICNLAGGENLYKTVESSTAKEAFRAWRKSPGHDALMLDPDFTSIGIGFAFGQTTSRFLFVSAVYYVYCWAAEFSSG